MSSIWGGVPPVSFGGSGGPANEGIDFTANHTGRIVGVSWYQAATNGPASVTGILYDTQTQLPIATQVAGALTPGAWNVIPFAAPVAITPGKIYTASAFISSGTNGFTSGALANHVFAADLTGLLRTGRFDNGAGAAFPTSKFPDSFGVDVEFTSTPTCPECPPCPPTQGFLINLTVPGFINAVTGVGDCVIGALEQTPAGAPCRQCLLLPTQVVPWDNCGPCDNDSCTGQVALAIREVYGSDKFPAPASGLTWAKCSPRWSVARVAVSVTRCVPTMDQTGEPPACVDELAAAVTLENDRTAVRQAIACCLNAAHIARPDLVGNWILGPSTTVGELGGCAGTETEFLVGVQSCPCPD